MNPRRSSIAWFALLVASVLGLWVAASWLYPLLPSTWDTSRAEATALATERFRDLGEPVEGGGYTIVRLRSEVQLERRLQLLAESVDPATLHDSQPAANQVSWEVLVYTEGAAPGAWTYRARIGRDGEVLSLRRQDIDADDEEASTTLDDEALASAARRHLEDLGVATADLELEAPEIRRLELGNRVGAVVRFPNRRAVLGPDHPYGTHVVFQGDEPQGFGFWNDDAALDEIDRVFRQAQLQGIGRMVLFYVLLPLVAVPFLRRYHDGQLGVRRGVQMALVALAAGLVMVVLDGRMFSEGTNIGFVNRRQTTWFISGFVLVFQTMGLAVLGMMSWSVGEFWCRQRWPQKLAALDAVFRGKWTNATVARSTLRGTAVGLALALGTLLLTTLFREQGAWALAGMVASGNGFDSPLPAVSQLAAVLSYFLPLFLFVHLLVPCWASQRLGSRLGLAVSLVVATLVSPAILVLPLEWGWPIAALLAIGPVLVFRFGDLLSALLAGLIGNLTVILALALRADDPTVQGHTLGALLVAALPMLVSLRFLGSDKEFQYTWDDVPAHVRRIAERERQRVELETARNIQSSILPDLPPQLQGVGIAHSYLPATEVGGDFYDVLALDDGRLAVAVGDVAGHGVSSGLVMSMARSALSVQVTFDPGVESVFHTLNRMVYQSARRRLLSTLCYAILDPRERELLYASAGHVFPYRVSSEGDVEALRAESYPLGVRSAIDVRVRKTKLEAGDSIFLYSDGLVEATVDGSDEPFGFDRLEDSLRLHAGKSPEQLRDAVLGDVERFTRRQIRDDDLTVLVLRLPAA